MKLGIKETVNPMNPMIKNCFQDQKFQESTLDDSTGANLNLFMSPTVGCCFIL